MWQAKQVKLENSIPYCQLKRLFVLKMCIRDRPYVSRTAYKEGSVASTMLLSLSLSLSYGATAQVGPWPPPISASNPLYPCLLYTSFCAGYNEHKVKLPRTLSPLH